jgi:hypothetical protein
VHFSIDITCPICPGNMLEKALDMAFFNEYHEHWEATHFGVLPVQDEDKARKFFWLNVADRRLVRPTLLFLARDPKQLDLVVSELPFKMNFKSAASFAANWLEQVDYGREYDTDGHCDKGWRVFNQDTMMFQFVAVQPDWIVYGK